VNIVLVYSLFSPRRQQTAIPVQSLIPESTDSFFDIFDTRMNETTHKMAAAMWQATVNQAT